MKVLQLNFDHPVKGNAFIKPASCDGHDLLHFVVESGDDNTLKIPVDICAKGEWILTLNWEHAGQLFTHKEQFTV